MKVVFVFKYFVKSKGVFDYYFVMNNWALEIIGFVIWNLFTKWFWIWLDFTRDRRIRHFMWPVRPSSGSRLDRRVMRGQTGAARDLCWFRFRIVYLDVRIYFMIMTFRWILYVCNTIVCCWWVKLEIAWSRNMVSLFVPCVGDSMSRESICGDGSGVGLGIRRRHAGYLG